MVDEARSLPHPIVVDGRYLHLSPAPSGPQHDERRSTITGLPGWLKRVATWFGAENKLGWAEGHRTVPSDAPLHPTVIERFGYESILIYGAAQAYRPEPLREHTAVKLH